MADDIVAHSATGYKARFCDRIPAAMTRRLLIWTVLFVSIAACAAEGQVQENPLRLKPHHATAAVADIDRAVRWYQQILGFAVVNRGERPNGTRFADLEIPGFGIGLVQNVGQAPPSTGAPRSGWVHIVFSVSDPAAAYATLKMRGADVSVRGNPAPPQITTFLLHDSEGNEIEIVKD
jgi:catechol 2,3-dioxygenase-like lactoylglutathione lyase family enzyme